MQATRCACAIALVLASLGSFGCNDSETLPTAIEEPTAGDYGVHFDESTRELTLTRLGQSLIKFGADGFAVGVVSKLDDQSSYDPTGFYTDVPLFAPPEDLVWRTVSAARVTARSRDRLDVTLELGPTTTAKLSLWINDTDRQRPGRFRAKLVPTTSEGEIAYIRLIATVDANEGFYGLGRASTR
ncbi:MAG: hypothetical protein U0165_12020 [Polyangiaceae bacterium]